MIESIWVTNQLSETLTLDLATSGVDEDIYVFSIEGLGSPVATVNSVGGPAVPGTRVNSVSVDARHIVLSLAITAQDTAEEAAIAKIYKHFPTNQEVTFGITGTNKEVYTEAYVESVEVAYFSKIVNATISLVCPPGYFKYVNGYSLEFETPAPGGGYYTGFTNNGPSVGALFTVSFSGAVTGLQFRDWNSNQLMRIVNPSPPPTPSSFQSGDLLVIDTRVGLKSVTLTRSSTDYNWIHAIPIQDDWIQFTQGNAWVVVEATSGIDNLAAQCIVTPMSEGF